MDIEYRQKKQIFIIIIYILIVILAGFLIYFWLKPKPSCFDGIQDQNETGVDCGGVCAKPCDNKLAEQNLAVAKKGFVLSGVANEYDLYAYVENPNDSVGSSNFQYEFKLKDSSGKIVGDRKGDEFILPGDSKYVIAPAVPVTGVPTSVEFSITDTTWAESNNLYEKPDIRIVNKNYTELDSPTEFSQATGLLENESPDDFTSIKVQVILTDGNGNVVALNSTQMGSVLAGESRDFTVFWPNQFPGSVSDMEIQPEVNIFNPQSFQTSVAPSS